MCPVQKSLGFSGMYFCMNGKAALGGGNRNERSFGKDMGLQGMRLPA